MRARTRLGRVIRTLGTIEVAVGYVLGVIAVVAGWVLPHGQADPLFRLPVDLLVGGLAFRLLSDYEWFQQSEPA